VNNYLSWNSLFQIKCISSGWSVNDKSHSGDDVEMTYRRTAGDIIRVVRNSLVYIRMWLFSKFRLLQFLVSDVYYAKQLLTAQTDILTNNNSQQSSDLISLPCCLRCYIRLLIHTCVFNWAVQILTCLQTSGKSVYSEDGSLDLVQWSTSVLQNLNSDLPLEKLHPSLNT
jgi:hypothetical protein